MSVLSLMTTAVTLKRQTALQQDSSGGAVKKPFVAVASATNVPADIQPASSAVQLRYAQREMLCSHQVFLAQDIGAAATDLLVASDGRVLKVLGYFDASAGRGRAWVADCEQNQ